MAKGIAASCELDLEAGSDAASAEHAVLGRRLDTFLKSWGERQQDS